MSDAARAAASERMRQINEARKTRAEDPPSVAHTCQWLPGDYKAHDGNGWRLVLVYCPVGKHWESTDA